MIRSAVLHGFIDRWLVSDTTMVLRQYQRRLGRPLNLADPQGFHEKLCWLRLNRMTPLHEYCSDKITMAAYVASRVGPGLTAPRYFTTRDPAALSAAAIPAAGCVIKGNHESQHVVIVQDTASADWPEIRAGMAASLKRNFYHSLRERQYRRITPEIIVEALLQAEPGAGAGDFNIYCIAGRARLCLQFAASAVTRNKPAAAVAPDGTPLDISRQIRPFVPVSEPPPVHLSRMVEIAECLAAPFDCVRVDFLTAGDDFRVNELTFSPFAGYNRFTPDAFEMELGALIDLKAAPTDWRPVLAAARAAEAATLPPRR